MNPARCLCVPAFLVFTAFALAQPNSAHTPTPTSGSNATDPVVLTPFSVSSERDVGYAAGDSLAASRFNTRLMDSPATVSVFTEEFLKDLGASSLAEVL